MASTDIALIPPTPAERWKYSETLAEANLIPAAYRRRPADVFYAVEYGAMLGLSPIAAMTGVHVIEGKPTASAALMSALVRKNGHRLRVTVAGTVEAGDLHAIAELVRSDDPDHTFVARWDLRRAQRAGLLTLKQDRDSGEWTVEARSEKGKPGSWEKYTEGMLKARVISEVCRDGAEECLFGMHYTPEELGAEVDADGDIVVVEQVDGADPQPARTSTASNAAARQDAADVVDAEVVGEEPPSRRTQDDAPGAKAEEPPAGLAVARAVAQAATRCGDYQELLGTYAEAKEKGLLDLDVRLVIGDAEAAVADLTGSTHITLETWLKKCGTYAKRNGGLSVYDTTHIDDATPDAGTPAA